MSPKAAAENPANPTEARKSALRQAYGQATKELRDLHRDEFNRLYARAARELGQEWSPRPSEEEQAEALFDDLLARYPSLRERVQPEPESSSE